MSDSPADEKGSSSFFFSLILLIFQPYFAGFSKPNEPSSVNSTPPSIAFCLWGAGIDASGRRIVILQPG
jgi:hypothetical protein